MMMMMSVGNETQTKMMTLMTIRIVLARNNVEHCLCRSCCLFCVSCPFLLLGDAAAAAAGGGCCCGAGVNTSHCCCCTPSYSETYYY